MACEVRNLLDGSRRCNIGLPVAVYQCSLGLPRMSMAAQRVTHQLGVYAVHRGCQPTTLRRTGQ